MLVASGITAGAVLIMVAQVLLLHGLEAVIEAADPAALADTAICDSVFQLVARCIRGDKNFRVAERALSMFKSDQFNNFVMQHRSTIIPRLIPALVSYSDCDSAVLWLVSYSDCDSAVLWLVSYSDSAALCCGELTVIQLCCNPAPTHLHCATYLML